MKKPYWVLLIAVVVCSCGRTKEVAPAPSSSLEDMQLTGKVKQITEINNTRVNPELFAFSKPGFGDVFFMDYYLSLYAYCEANGINYINDIIAGRRDVPDEFDYYYEDQGADDFAYTIYSFDKSGYLTRTQCYWEKMEGNPTEQEINTYDDQHRLLRSEHLNDSLKVCYAHDLIHDARLLLHNLWQQRGVSERIRRVQLHDTGRNASRWQTHPSAAYDLQQR